MAIYNLVYSQRSARGVVPAGTATQRQTAMVAPTIDGMVRTLVEVDVTYFVVYLH